MGLGPVFWLRSSEIYPSRVRGPAMGIATLANWTANFVVTISFLSPLSVLTNAGTFPLFALLTLVALAYFVRKVPETKGMHLSQIETDVREDRFTGRGAPAPARRPRHRAA